MPFFDLLRKLGAGIPSPTAHRPHARSRKSPRRMAVESLENRQLCAVDVTLSTDGLLRIIGDADHNYADVMRDADQLVVYTVRNRLDATPDAPMIHTFPSSAVEQLFFEGLAGDDYFINRLELPSVMFGGEGDDTLVAGSGRNSLYGEAGWNDLTHYEGEQPSNALLRSPLKGTLRGPQDQSPLAIYYRQLDQAATILGQPTNEGQEFASLDGQAKMRTYEHGVIVWTASHGAVHVVGNILKKWESLGGFNNPTLGNPVTSEGLYSLSVVTPTSDTIQKFEFGVIMNRPTVGNQAFEVHGAIFQRWSSVGVLTQVGLPRSDELPTEDGKGRISRFDRGSIVWDRDTNSTTIIRPIGMKLVSPGNALNNKLLFLTSVAPASLGGLNMSTTTKDFYAKLGGEKGILGPQVSGERLIGSKLVFVTEFKFGAIYRTMDSLFEVHGAIYQKYVQLGGPAGVLGLPRTNETAVGDAAGGRFSTFEYGVILWTPAVGAHEIHGDIWRTWSNQGQTRGTLGYPVSDEQDVSVNSEFRVGKFQNGAIFYSPETGSIVLQGQPWQQWKAYGSEQSFLGAPMGSTQVVTLTANGRLVSAQRTPFEGGTMTVRNGAPAALDFQLAQLKFALQQVALEGTSVTQVELQLLRSFLTAPHTMPAYVANLLGKLLNGDLANTTYRQTFLGNLSVNSPNSQFVKLIDKWFGGGERPRARGKDGTYYNYAYADGVLFGPAGPRSLDIDQGALGDCYLLASLASIAAKNPQAIRDMIIDNGDDTYTIRFFREGQAEYVTVDRFLPTNSEGALVFALGGRAASLSAVDAAVSPLWFALIEKAFVIAASSGWIEDQARSNDYGGVGSDAGIAGGNAALTLPYLLGNIAVRDELTAVYEEGADDAIINREQSKTKFLEFKSQLIAAAYEYSLLCTPNSVTSARLVKNHCYVVFAANEQGLTLFNPHGGANAVFRITWSEAAGNFDQWVSY
jgi:uncharacterized protein with LGFP repeats